MVNWAAYGSVILKVDVTESIDISHDHCPLDSEIKNFIKFLCYLRKKLKAIFTFFVTIIIVQTEKNTD